MSINLLALTTNVSSRPEAAHLAAAAERPAVDAPQLSVKEAL
jgi:hypothetical protein